MTSFDADDIYSLCHALAEEYEQEALGCTTRSRRADSAAFRHQYTGEARAYWRAAEIARTAARGVATADADMDHGAGHLGGSRPARQMAEDWMRSNG